MKDILGAIVIVAIALFLLPTVILFAIWLGVYGIIIVPIVGMMYLVWRFIKAKGWLNEGKPPAHAKPIISTPKKKRMVKWQGKEIPLGVFIFSMGLTVMMTPIIILLMLFYVPPLWTVLILGFVAGKKIAKHTNRKVAHV